jgi:hypothetical protein
MGDKAMGRCDDQSPGPGGAENSARRGCDCSIELIRAGFEPSRARAGSERLDYRLNRWGI